MGNQDNLVLHELTRTSLEDLLIFEQVTKVKKTLKKKLLSYDDKFWSEKDKLKKSDLRRIRNIYVNYINALETYDCMLYEETKGDFISYLLTTLVGNNCKGA
jgi:hypothetical protein